jgi:hypothetical protein
MGTLEQPAGKLSRNVQKCGYGTDSRIGEMTTQSCVNNVCPWEALFRCERVWQIARLFSSEHGRRKILHFNVTRHPTAEWVVQQLREAFPEAGPYRYVILDRDAKFDAEVVAFLQGTGLRAKRTSVGSPWRKAYVSYCTSLV